MNRNLLLALFFFTGFISYSQFFHNVGLKTGISLTNQTSENEGIHLNNEDGYEYRPGLSIGLSSEMFRKKHFSLISDLAYIQKGIKFEPGYTLDPNTGEFTPSKVDQTRYDFLNLNLMGKFRWEFGNIAPFVIAGPRLDFFLNYSKYNKSPYRSNTDYDPVIFGMTYGLGVDYSLSDFIIGFEAVHQPDFTNFSDFYTEIVGFGDFYYSSSKTKNKAFAFLISLRYQLP